MRGCCTYCGRAICIGVWKALSARGMEVRSGGERIRWMVRSAGRGDAEAPKDYIPIVWKGRCVGQGTSGLAEGSLSARAGPSQLRMRSNACRIRLPFACCCTWSTPSKPRLSTPPTGYAARGQWQGRGRRTTRTRGRCRQSGGAIGLETDEGRTVEMHSHLNTPHAR
jgi:hypothetical protein